MASFSAAFSPPRDLRTLARTDSPVGEKLRAFEQCMGEALGPEGCKDWKIDQADLAARRIRQALSAAAQPGASPEDASLLRQLSDRIVSRVLPESRTSSPRRCLVFGDEPATTDPAPAPPDASLTARDPDLVAGWSGLLLSPKVWRGASPEHGSQQRVHLLQSLCTKAHGQNRPSVLALVRQVLCTAREWPLAQRLQLAQGLGSLVAARAITLEEAPELGDSLWAMAATWHGYPLACALKLASSRASPVAVRMDRATALCTLAMALDRTAARQAPRATRAQLVAMGIGVAGGPRANHCGDGAEDPADVALVRYVQPADLIIDMDRHPPGLVAAIKVLPAGLLEGLRVAVQPELALGLGGLSAAQRFECLALAEALRQDASEPEPAFSAGASPAQAPRLDSPVERKDHRETVRESKHQEDSGDDSDDDAIDVHPAGWTAAPEVAPDPVHAAWLRRVTLAGGQAMDDAAVRGLLEFIANDCGMPLHDVGSATTALVEAVGPQRVREAVAGLYGVTHDLQRAAMAQAIARLEGRDGPIVDGDDA